MKGAPSASWFLRLRLILTGGGAQQWQCMMVLVLLVALGQALLHRDWDGTAVAVYGILPWP